MVPVINDLFKVILLLTFQPKHAEVIDDYQIEPFYFFEELELMPFNAGQFKLIQQSAYSIVPHLVSQPAGTLSQSTGKEGLACSGGAADYDGGSCLEIFSGGKLVDCSGRYSSGITGFQFLNACMLLEVGVPYQPVYPVVASAVQFALKQQFKAVGE